MPERLSGPTALTSRRILKGLPSRFLNPTKKIFHFCKTTAYHLQSQILIFFITSAKYKCKVGKRLIQEFERSTASTSAGGSSGPRVNRPKPPLDRMEFVLHTSAFSTKTRDDIKKTIIRMGGKAVSKVSDMTMAVVSTEGLWTNKILIRLLST